MFTQRHFEAIANILAGDLAVSKYSERNRVRCIILSMADLFAKDNARFNRERFYLACGLSKGGYLLLTEKQRKALQDLSDRYKVDFNQDDFVPQFDLPEGWVGGMVSNLVVGCSPDGEIHS